MGPKKREQLQVGLLVVLAGALLSAVAWSAVQVYRTTDTIESLYTSATTRVQGETDRIRFLCDFTAHQSGLLMRSYERFTPAFAVYPLLMSGDFDEQDRARWIEYLSSSRLELFDDRATLRQYASNDLGEFETSLSDIQRILENEGDFWEALDDALAARGQEQAEDALDRMWSSIMESYAANANLLEAKGAEEQFLIDDARTSARSDSVLQVAVTRASRQRWFSVAWLLVASAGLALLAWAAFAAPARSQAHGGKRRKSQTRQPEGGVGGKRSEKRRN